MLSNKLCVYTKNGLQKKHLSGKLIILSFSVIINNQRQAPKFRRLS
jgi:hypothetical protein